MLNKEKRFLLLATVLLVVSFVSFVMVFFMKGSSKEEHIKKAVEQSLPKIAIVLDDWGYNKKYLDLLDAIDAPLTISVLPELVYSKYIAEREGDFLNREVILHMPMEPESSSVRLEKLTLLTTMSTADAKRFLKVALKSVPNAKGISNHMGSKATKDADLMQVVLEYIKHKEGYFLDSYSSDKSVCKNVANLLDVDFVKRDVFLDNNLDEKYIRGQFDELVDIAKIKGSAIGIGHNHKLTLEVIKERVDALRDAEIEFVLASELIQKR
ncbi:MAG: divergent polysaccharide deacetylase family protein [Candidatus Omnitrophota bacterium]